jgi:hypothetical protein
MFGAGLLTLPKRPTEGLPFLETSGQAQGRGLETRAQRGAVLIPLFEVLVSSATGRTIAANLSCRITYE